MVAQMGGHLKRVNSSFPKDDFIERATRDFEKLELKERSNQIRDALAATLDADFRQACKTLRAALHPVEDAELGEMSMDQSGVRGWAIMPMADYIATHGLDDFDHSLDILADMTKRFSAEFAVRHFFIADSNRALSKAHEWTTSDNVHVRRFASEGSRPRLPWGLQLTRFVEDPSPLLPLLEKLKDDDSEYVRRSVANNLNDIAKDHPDLVAATAKAWLPGASNDQQRMIKHACRSLVKQGHKPTLKALGYSAPKVEIQEFNILTPIVKLGDALEFAIELTSTAKKMQPLIIDFVVHHRKANGTTSPKTFKWKIIDLVPGETFKAAKKHPVKPVTTRVYYEGTHSLEIQINGESLARSDFELVL